MEESFRDKPSRKYTKADWVAFFESEDARFRQFRDAVPGMVEELGRLASKLGGPVVDFTVESFEPLARWWEELARADFDDGADWTAPWAYWDDHFHNPNVDVGIRLQLLLMSRLDSPSVFRMRERLTAYYGEVLIRRVEGARWACWRGFFNDDARNGRIVVDVGNPVFPGDAIYAPPIVDGAYCRLFDPSHVGYEEPDPLAMLKSFDLDMTKRARFLELHGSPVWQVASCGPAANTGRAYARGASGARIDAFRDGTGGLPTVFRGPLPPPDPTDDAGSSVIVGEG